MFLPDPNKTYNPEVTSISDCSSLEHAKNIGLSESCGKA